MLVTSFSRSEKQWYSTDGAGAHRRARFERFVPMARPGIERAWAIGKPPPSPPQSQLLDHRPLQMYRKPVQLHGLTVSAPCFTAQVRAPLPIGKGLRRCA